MRQLTDTISAISTPTGYGGIGIVRISGPDSISIAQKIFRKPNNKPFAKVESHRMVYGSIIDPETEQTVDEVMLTVMKAPASYTSEDIVEISCHGSLYITQRILDLTLKTGARLSEPGEFTRRAFLNGKINLAQAEGVIDLINSRSDRSHEAALAEVNGDLIKEISVIKEGLFAIAMEVESEIDFSEEEIEVAGSGAWLKEIEKAKERITALLKTFDRGKIIREGLSIAIVGRPNVGKSSLMNSLLKQERAIVSEMPGTTRDTIEERLSVNGLTVELIDTAGIQETENPVEQQGISRTKNKIDESDILIIVFDGSEALTKDDTSLLETVINLGKPFIKVINKIDKGLSIDKKKLKPGKGLVCEVSAREKQGVDALITSLSETIWEHDKEFKEELIITRRRHFDLLAKSAKNLERGLTMLMSQTQIELFALDLKEAIMALGEISGETYTEDLLDKIFSEFCIGK